MSITFKKDANWKRFQRALSESRFRKALEKHVGRATGQNAHFVQGQVRKRIQGNEYDANADLTSAIKEGKANPLVDIAKPAGIWGSISIEREDWRSAFVGVLKRQDDYNVALTLHEGTEIKVTPKMRGMFFLLWLKSQGRDIALTGRAAELWRRMPGGWKNLGEDTTTIAIPERPFLARVFGDKKVRLWVMNNWVKAVNMAIQEGAK